MIIRNFKKGERMVNGDDYALMGPSMVVPSKASGYRVEAAGQSPARDAPPPRESTQENDISETDLLARMAEKIEDISLRIDALMEAVAPLVTGAETGGDSPDEGTAAQDGINAAKDALIYTAFFQEAVRLGMSPAMVSDAYRLAELTEVTADLETREVTGAARAAELLLETKPYLFTARPTDVGSETNPARGPSSYPEQVEGLARALGVSPGFAAELVKRRSEKARGGLDLSEIWRVPRGGRLSYLETRE
jgi:hypothetical protein